jgi:hypothetical protein
MRTLLGGLGLATLMAFMFFAAPVEAQTSATTKKIDTSRKYDAQNESTLSGTVQSVISNPTSGMLIGVHLILSTSSGTVDADLGPFALKGNSPVSVSAGEAVTVVGVMMTVRKSQVFMARTLQTPQQTYTLRNQNGFPLMPSNGSSPSTVLRKGELR